MVGEYDLRTLLATMSPKLMGGEYVFCTLPGEYGDYVDLEPLASFREAEGLTLIIPKENAGKLGLNDPSFFKCITLSVHSSLDAVGLTAAIATKLSEKGISANVVAAYFHDHIFVQSERALAALEALAELGR